MTITAELLQKWLVSGAVPGVVRQRTPRILVPSWSRNFNREIMEMMRHPLEGLKITFFGMDIIRYAHGIEIHFMDPGSTRARILGKSFDFVIMDVGERFPDPLGYVIFSSLRDGGVIISDLTGGTE